MRPSLLIDNIILYIILIKNPFLRISFRCRVPVGASVYAVLHLFMQLYTVNMHRHGKSQSKLLQRKVNGGDGHIHTVYIVETK